MIKESTINISRVRQNSMDCLHIDGGFGVLNHLKRKPQMGCFTMRGGIQIAKPFIYAATEAKCRFNSKLLKSKKTDPKISGPLGTSKRVFFKIKKLLLWLGPWIFAAAEKHSKKGHRPGCHLRRIIRRKSRTSIFYLVRANQLLPQSTWAAW